MTSIDFFLYQFTLISCQSALTASLFALNAMEKQMIQHLHQCVPNVVAQQDVWLVETSKKDQQQHVFVQSARAKYASTLAAYVVRARHNFARY